MHQLNRLRFFVLLALLLILPVFASANAKIGLALSGGGARGFAHIGILKVIDEIGLPVDCLAGTSMGSLVGALYSMGYNATEIESLVLHIDWEQELSDVISRNDLYIGQKRWAPYGNITFSLDDNYSPRLPQGLINGERLNLKLFDLFYDASSYTCFDSLPIEFRSVATDLLTGQAKVFDRGSLFEAVRASITIPSAFRPFELDGNLYIDGGISQNLPAETVKDMGADYIIGLKVNSRLRPKSKLNDLLQVIDQTINIGMTQKVNQSMSLCDLVIEPELTEYSVNDFKDIQQIIDAGEAAARAYYPVLKQLKDTLQRDDKYNHIPNLPDSLCFKTVLVNGNQYLSSTKVKDYASLTSDACYTNKQLLQKMEEAYHSQLFDMIYPVIVPDSVGYYLTVKTQETRPGSLSLNLSYNNTDDFIMGAVFSLNNVLLKNSRLLVDLKLGGKHELNVDYVKNFGKYWGIYFRIFPYLNEKTIYFYNDNHERTNSVTSMEAGFTNGIGFFAKNLLVLEGYTFFYRTRLYQDVAQVHLADNKVVSSGIGVKLYHESLDDYVFPMRGVQFISKLSRTQKGIASDITYSKYQMKFQVLIPFHPQVSLRYGFEYGTSFDNTDSGVNPFYVGGLDSFLGYQSYEKSAPYYKINTTTLRISPINRLYIDLQVNGLNSANSDIWQPFKNVTWGYGSVIGYQSFLGPVRLGYGLNEDNTSNFYASIGYDFDMFNFSRR